MKSRIGPFRYTRTSAMSSQIGSRFASRDKRYTDKV